MINTKSSNVAGAPGNAFSSYQKFVVAVLAFLQFTIVLDFMVLSPLGALVIPTLKITPAQFGLIVSAYAFSAGVSGFLTAGFADRSVLGIPVALLLSTHWGWNAPFFMIVAVSALVGGMILIYMRPVTEHLKQHPDRSPLHHLIHTVSNRVYLQGFATTGLLTVGGFMLMPFMTVFIVHNVGLPVDKLPLLYVITGAFSIVAGPLIGRASDALGKFKVFSFGCAMTVVMVVIYTHLHFSPLWLLVVVTVLLQIGIFSRMISSSALMSALPKPADRGSYMSISSSLQQVSGGVAAFVGGLIVVQTPEGLLLHFDTLGYVLVCTTLVSLALMYLIDRRIKGMSEAPMAVQESAA